MDRLEQLTNLYHNFSVDEALKQTAQIFPGGVTFSSSLGQEDQVLTDIISRNNIPVRIFTIDTGRLFNETYETIEKTRARYRINIDMYFPQADAVQNMVNEHGPNLLPTVKPVVIFARLNL